MPQTFWGDLSGTLEHIGAAKQLAPLKDDIDELLRLYIRRNGAFQVEPLLKGVMAAAGDPAAGVDWIAEMSRSAATRCSFSACCSRSRGSRKRSMTRYTGGLWRARRRRSRAASASSNRTRSRKCGDGRFHGRSIS